MFGFFKKKELTLGQRGEQIAQEEYKKRGYKIVAANFFNKKGLRRGEVDVIAVNKGSIIFVEVKTRASETGRFGSGVEAVNFAKQRKLLTAMQLFLSANPQYAKLKPQIDVCIIVLEAVDKAPKSVTILANVVEDGR